MRKVIGLEMTVVRVIAAFFVYTTPYTNGWHTSVMCEVVVNVCSNKINVEWIAPSWIRFVCVVRPLAKG